MKTTLDTKYTVAIFGVGSLGANTALTISRRFGQDVGFYIIDCGVIEDKNRKNQPWFDVNVGQKKVSVLASSLWHQSNARSKVFSKKVSSMFDVKNLNIKDRLDLIIDCFDNPASRRLTNDYAKELKIDILHSGFYESGFKCDWNSKFTIRKGSDQSREPICDRRDLACIVQIGAALTAESCYQYFINKKKSGYFFDLTGGKIFFTNL